MERFKGLIPNVWHEAGRHTDIAAFTTNIVHLPVCWLPISGCLYGVLVRACVS